MARDQILKEKRNTSIHERFNYWYEVKRLRLDDVFDKLKGEFFLSKRTLEIILNGWYNKDVKEVIETIYIAGKVTGEDYDLCFKKFEEHELALINLGYKVINPLKLTNADTPYEEAMKICFDKLAEADGLYLMRDWMDSPGANKEYCKAMKLGLKFFYSKYPPAKVLSTQ